MLELKLVRSRSHLEMSRPSFGQLAGRFLQQQRARALAAQRPGGSGSSGGGSGGPGGEQSNMPQGALGGLGGLVALAAVGLSVNASLYNGAHLSSAPAVSL